MTQEELTKIFEKVQKYIKENRPEQGTVPEDLFEEIGIAEDQQEHLIAVLMCWFGPKDTAPELKQFNEIYDISQKYKDHPLMDLISAYGGGWQRNVIGEDLWTRIWEDAVRYITCQNKEIIYAMLKGLTKIGEVGLNIFNDDEVPDGYVAAYTLVKKMCEFADFNNIDSNKISLSGGKLSIPKMRCWAIENALPIKVSPSDKVTFLKLSEPEDIKNVNEKGLLRIVKTLKDIYDEKETYRISTIDKKDKTEKHQQIEVAIDDEVIIEHCQKIDILKCCCCTSNCMSCHNIKSWEPNEITFRDYIRQAFISIQIPSGKEYKIIYLKRNNTNKFMESMLAGELRNLVGLCKYQKSVEKRINIDGRSDVPIRVVQERIGLRNVLLPSIYWGCNSVSEHLGGNTSHLVESYKLEMDKEATIDKEFKVIKKKWGDVHGNQFKAIEQALREDTDGSKTKKAINTLMESLNDESDDILISITETLKEISRRQKPKANVKHNCNDCPINTKVCKLSQRATICFQPRFEISSDSWDNFSKQSDLREL